MDLPDQRNALEDIIEEELHMTGYLDFSVRLRTPTKLPTLFNHLLAQGRDVVREVVDLNRNAHRVRELNTWVFGPERLEKLRRGGPSIPGMVELEVHYRLKGLL